ncbi:MFS transporter [Candidatus Methylacidithermus pantelleriae]|uniref:Major facilitator superfamily MFS_1 n=1 Tax=Candidatus Methylacidithermus pantelleriae TaxID=2744239 RepID=A0A8J2FPF0_9BACT|nr:MFS transporter [Candidatus Methylacidithermus pantelleriae]CAF0702325.1 Major facilitator superfamily MFS_1 [Candidatus Methylacidithermus pantelleriae]
MGFQLDRRIRYLSLSMAAYRLSQGVSFPFLSLHLHNEVGLSLGEVGLGIGLLAGGTIFSSLASGWMVDRMGRKPVIIASVLGLAVASSGYASTSDFLSYLGFCLIGGLLGSGAYETSRNAMVADWTPVDQRGRAYGLLRIGGNVGWSLGPLLAAWLLGKGWVTYRDLFFLGAAIHGAHALWLALVLEESFPRELQADQESRVAGKLAFETFVRSPSLKQLTYLFTYSVLLYVVFTQNWQAVPVYARNFLGMQDRAIGILLSTNGTMVILLQGPMAAWVDRQQKARVLAIAAVLFAVSGAILLGWHAGWALFVSFTLFFTLGEMLLEVGGPALAAELAPPEIRGRVLGVYGSAWAISYTVSPLLAGFLLDARRPDLLWLSQVILSAMAFILATKLGRTRPFFACS